MVAYKEASLIAARGEVITRVVVSVENDVYFVRKREEFDAAKKEKPRSHLYRV
jgi:hypothetical protein